MKKILTAAAIAAAATLAAATPASATVYKYKQTNGDILQLNTATNSGTLIGRKINVSFKSNDIGSFTGGANPRAIFVLDDLNGYRIVNGRKYYDNPSHTQKLKITDGGRTNLWSYWGYPARYGDYITTIAQYFPPANSSSGSTGGTTSSGGSTGGGSTGGTDVPAPGMILLFGAGAAALAFRRRKAAKAGE